MLPKLQTGRAEILIIATRSQRAVGGQNLRQALHFLHAPLSARTLGLAYDERETSPPSIPASGRECCHSPGRIADRTRASLSVTAGAHRCRLSSRRRLRYHSKTDRSVAVGAVGTAVRY